MPTFIDESGDTGWLRGSLPYFRLGAIWLPTFDAVEACRESIREVRKKAGMRANDEFKFSKTGRYPERRRAFFQALLAHEFRFAACGYDKSRMEKESMQAAEFFNGCALVLATHLRKFYLHAESVKAEKEGRRASLNELVVVDNNQDQRFLKEIKKAFSTLESASKPGAKLVKKVKFRSSEPDEMLQSVDMIVGAVGAKFDGDDTWYDLIAKRGVAVVLLP